MPWQPGESGNPNGRPPKGFALSDLLEAVGNAPDKESGKPKWVAMLERLFGVGISAGSEDKDVVAAARVLLDTALKALEIAKVKEDLAELRGLYVELKKERNGSGAD